MSGGSYNYAYRKIADLADDIRPTSLLRKAFKSHLRKVAEACHDIELVDSHDARPGDEDEAIRKCLGKDGPKLMLSEAVAEAVLVKAELDAAIDIAYSVHNAKNSVHNEASAVHKDAKP